MTIPLSQDILNELEAICAKQGLTFKDVRFGGRHNEIVLAVHECVNLLKKYEIEDTRLSRILLRDRSAISRHYTNQCSCKDHEIKTIKSI